MESEGRLESFKKLMKRFRDRLSRKTNLSDDLYDIIHGMYNRVDTYVRQLTAVWVRRGLKKVPKQQQVA